MGHVSLAGESRTNVRRPPAQGGTIFPDTFLASGATPKYPLPTFVFGDGTTFPLMPQVTQILVTANQYSNLACDGVTDDLANLTALYALAPDHSFFVWPPCTMVLSNVATIPAGKHFAHVGAGPNKTFFLSIHPTADHIDCGDWQSTFTGITFETATATTTSVVTLPVATIPISALPTGASATGGSLTIATTTGWQVVTYTSFTAGALSGCTGGTGNTSVGGVVVNKTAGYAVNMGANAQTWIQNCSFSNCFNEVLMNGTLCSVRDSQSAACINFGLQCNGSTVNAIVHNCTADGLPGAIAHLELNQFGSILVSDCDFIHGINNVRINPTSPTGDFGGYFLNTYFDTASGSSVKVMGTGNVQRIKFLACWFSNSTNGMEFASTATTLPTAIDITNCDFYSNSGAGILATAPGVADWSCSQSRFAGNGTGVSIGPGSTHWPRLYDNRIGPTGGIGANTTGIAVTAGAYAGLRITDNDVTGNTTNFTLGALTVTAGTESQFHIQDNSGINPRNVNVAPSVPSSGTAVTNATGFECQVWLHAGNITALSIGGVTTGLSAAIAGGFPFQLPPGESVAITYSSAPTWTWIAQ